MLTITDTFKHKETGRKVIYKNICTYEDIVQERDTEGKIQYETYAETIKDCVICEDCDTHGIYVIPVLQFMCYYAPVSDYIDDLFSTFENIKTLENEGYKENIHPLHSGESETNEVGSPEGVQE